MSNQTDKQTREGIARASRDLVRASRGSMTFEQARNRVTKAKQRGDRIRNNDNK